MMHECSTCHSSPRLSAILRTQSRSGCQSCAPRVSVRVRRRALGTDGSRRGSRTLAYRFQIFLFDSKLDSL
jgi:hypothetical protein